MAQNTLLDKVLSLQDKFQSLQDQLASPEVMSDMKKFVQLNKDYKQLEPIIKAGLEYKKTVENLQSAKDILLNEKDDDLREMAREEISELEPKIPQMEENIKLLLIPADPDDSKNAIVEIRGGAGGDEAAIFAGDLFRMYQHYAESKGWTSAASVAVFPEAGEFDVDLRWDDIRLDLFCSSGPGGQGVNTTYSAVRLTHIPTGLVVQCQEERSQLKNKDRAFEELRTRLYNLEHQKYLDEIASKRKTMVSTGDRSAKSRTYNYPQGRVTDHRINWSMYNLPVFMNGDIQEVIDQLQIAENAERLKEAGD